MVEYKEIEELTPTELLFLQKHLKLGKEHLQTRLSQSEVEELFRLGQLNKQTEKTIAVDKPEIAGNVAMVFNTFFTTILGAWLGIRGFMQLGSGAPLLLFSILLLSIVVGALVGYTNYRHTKRVAQHAVEKRKTKTAENNILKILTQQRQEEIKAQIKEVGEMLKEMKIVPDGLSELFSAEFNDHELSLKWLEQAKPAVQALSKNGEIAQRFEREVQELKNKLEENLRQDEQKKKRRALLLLNKLSLNPPHIQFRAKSWIRENIQDLLFSLIPVALGGFSTFLGYVGGTVPQISHALGWHRLAEFLNQPQMRILEFVVAFALTLYFTYSFFYTSWKNFKRDQELSKMDAIVTEEEHQLQLLDDKFLKIKQVEENIKPIYQLYHTLRQLVKES